MTTNERLAKGDLTIAELIAILGAWPQDAMVHLNRNILMVKDQDQLKTLDATPSYCLQDNLYKWPRKTRNAMLATPGDILDLHGKHYVVEQAVINMLDKKDHDKVVTLRAMLNKKYDRNGEVITHVVTCPLHVVGTYSGPMIGQIQ